MTTLHPSNPLGLLIYEGFVTHLPTRAPLLTRTTWGSFKRENLNGLGLTRLAEMLKQLKAGEIVTTGGGAAPAFSLVLAPRH